MIAEALRKSREQTGMTQRAVATLLGVSYPYLCDMENGRRSFPKARLPELPDPIRRAVARAMIQKHQEAIREIKRLANGALHGRNQ